MSITISRAKRAGNNFEIISRDFLRDARLSLKARGLGGWLMTHADGFTITVNRIAELNGCGVELVKAGLRELERFGYLQRGQARDGGKFGASMYHVTDQGLPDDGDTVSGKHVDGKSTPYKESTPKEYHSEGEQQDLSEGQRSAQSGELALDLPRLPVKSPEPGAQSVVATYVDRFRARTGRTPLGRDLAKIGKEAKRLLEDGVDPAELMSAARRMADTKFTDLATAYRESGQMIMKPSTTDQRVAAALALAQKYKDQERAAQ